MSIARIQQLTGKCPACKAENVILKDVGGLLLCEKCSSKRFSAKVRKRIQEAFERQEEIKRHEQWMKRVEVAKRGVRAFEKRKYIDALKLFREYVAILEARYNVGAGGLRPDLFDTKKEAGEILLLSGVFWDMAKIYDRLRGNTAEVRMCLNKFIEFSINRPHVAFSANEVRKYLRAGNVMNKADFNNAYGVLHQHVAKCFLASAVFGPVSPEVAALQAFRDRVLLPRPAGRVAVGAYYAVSPAVAGVLVRAPWAGSLFRWPLRLVVRLIQ